ncbi:MAG: hypothetical protein KL787_05175 [Taibaiella sp.]|nr:hypothetical protein [Taibaiella sp.]
MVVEDGSLRKEPGKPLDIQNYLPAPKALQQLKKEEAERVDQLRQLNAK